MRSWACVSHRREMIICLWGRSAVNAPRRMDSHAELIVGSKHTWIIPRLFACVWGCERLGGGLCGGGVFAPCPNGLFCLTVRLGTRTPLRSAAAALPLYLIRPERKDPASEPACSLEEGNSPLSKLYRSIPSSHHVQEICTIGAMPLYPDDFGNIPCRQMINHDDLGLVFENPSLDR